MSTLYEERQAIIQDLLPKLVESLTNFERNTENFLLCEQFAWSTLKFHKCLSVNSYAIKRKMEGLFERLYFDNKERFAVRLKEIFEDLITDPICLNHEEPDIHWGILCFLLILSQNPVGVINKKLRNNYSFENFFTRIEIPVVNNKNLDLIEELKACNFEVDLWKDCDTESTLSDWSSSDNDINFEDCIGETSKPNNFVQKEVVELSLIKYKPPTQAQQSNHITFDYAQSEKWLKDYIQINWWSDNNFKYEVNSEHRCANFCEYWNQHLSSVSNNYIKEKVISTISEYCLMREILWMFHNPCACKFFKISGDEIVLTENVSLNSTTMEGLRSFLLIFTKHMTINYRLKLFCRSVTSNSNKTDPPYTYESYAMGLELFLKDISHFVIAKEETIALQSRTQSTTIISLCNDFNEKFNLLSDLWELHTHVILDWNKFPAHICSSHLLCSLFTIVRQPANSSVVPIAISLFLTSIKTFLTIIDTWWSEGRLLDMRNEFLVKKTFDESFTTIVGYSVRYFVKSKQNSFYISSDITKIIENEPIFQIFLHHSLEAGYTLNILYILDRMSELRKFTDNYGDLYDTFLLKLFKALESYGIQTEESLNSGKSNENISDNCSSSHIDEFKRDIQIEMGDDDTLLLALAGSVKLLEQNYNPNNSIVQHEIEKFDYNNAHDIYLKISKSLMQPENIITRLISDLLSSKMLAANTFVTTIYREEFHLLKHLRYIRCVLLLEGSDLMYFFYNKLFQQIEAGDNWANPYLLTTQLNDVLCSKYPDMSSLFSVHLASILKCRTKNVLNAIDQIHVIYGLNNNLKNLITPASLDAYVQVFQFLLKVNWALWSLENLRFPEFYKKRIPYSKLSMMDFKVRRLVMLKFWIIFAVKSIHTHLMTQFLQNCGKQLEEDMNQARSFKEMVSIHESYIATIYDYSFQHADNVHLLKSILQLLSLVQVLRDVWINMCATGGNSFVDADTSNLNDSMLNDAEINNLEKTYIKCHELIGNALKYSCYKKNKTHLSGLCSAFNYSIPY